MKLMLGSNIRCLRREKHITQEQLAEKLGVSCQSVSRWENDTCYPDMELLPALARIFSVSVDRLLGVSEEDKHDKLTELLKQLSLADATRELDKLITLIATIRRDYTECLAVVQLFEIAIQKELYRVPSLLAELRLTAEEIISHAADVWMRDTVIENMARMEDDSHIEAFLQKYAEFPLLTRKASPVESKSRCILSTVGLVDVLPKLTILLNALSTYSYK